MRTLSALAYWEGVILLGGFVVVVLWKLLTGGIRLDGLLEGDIPDAASPDGYSSYPSAGRAQSLLVTLFVSFYYLALVIQNPKQFPQLPNEIVAVVAGSQALYLSGKARAMLSGRVRNKLGGSNEEP